jgi:integrase
MQNTASITQRYVNGLKPSSSARFIRDNALVGFGVKVMPTGRISFIVEARIRGGSTKRITLGQSPALSASKARDRAGQFIQLMQSGIDPVKARRAEVARQEGLSKPVADVFNSYLANRDLKEITKKDYSTTFRLVFSSWANRPIRDITRQDAEEVFAETRDNRGHATATKAFRIISAVFNYAMADEVNGERLITENPVDVLKQKGIRRNIKKREGYLDDRDISKLITFFHDAKDWPETPKHGVTNQGINYVMLLMATGLRKSEALSLQWGDVDWYKETFLVRDTKNGSSHHVPMSSLTKWMLKKQQEVSRGSEWVFPARYGANHMTEPKSQLRRIKAATGLSFSLHDLRRTFATHANAQGVEYENIRRALNHKSGGSVTSQYIISQIETLRPVFQAVADGYHQYYDPGSEGDMVDEEDA